MMLNFEELLSKTNNDKINSGDLLIVKGNNSLLTKLIQFLTGSSFTHTAMLVKIDNSWFVLETRQKNSFNYQMMPANWWFQRYPNEEAYIGKMPIKKVVPEYEEKVKQTALHPKESIRPYKMRWLAIVYILQEWLGFYRPQVQKKKKPMICSTFIQETWERAGVIKEGNYKTPGDIVNLIGGEEALIPLNYQSLLTTKSDDIEPQYKSNPREENSFEGLTEAYI